MALVFIGSSTEAQDTAEAVAQALASHPTIRPLRWWEAFRSGDLTLDRLRALADYVDAAVMVWDADNSTWHRGKKEASTRDNCLLEYGIFVSKLGRERTGVFARDGVRIPSDVSGVTVKFYKDATRDKVAAELADELSRSLNPPNQEIVPVLADEKLQEKALSPDTIPKEWAGRALYMTDAGARKWLALANEPDYPLNGFSDQLGVQRLYRTTLLGSMPRAALQRVDRIVSLGPGDARAERQVLEALRPEPGMCFEWVPVDISHGLLNLAVSRLSRSFAIPMGIVGDFEDGLSFIFDRLLPGNGVSPRAPNDPRPALLVTMLGGSFANMDGSEQGFLDNLKARLVENDYVLLDLPLKGDDWSAESDPRSQVSKYPTALREFLACGLAARLGISEQDVLRDFDTRIQAQVDEHASHIPRSAGIRITDSELRQALLIFRRYEAQAAKAWLASQTGLQLMAFEVTPKLAAGKDTMRMAVALLRKS